MPWVVFTNIYVALCGACLAAATYVLLGQPMRLDHTAGLVFCCTLVIYNLDRLVEPKPGDSEQERWVESHQLVLWALTSAGAIGAILLMLQLSTAGIITLLVSGAIAMGYCLPILYYNRSWHRLKALPGAKLLLIALVWTYATAGLPILESGLMLDRQTVAILLARFFFIAAVALPFDLPDMQRDRQSGIATLPILFGVGATRSIAVVLIVLSVLFSAFNPWPYAAALLISCACVTGLIAVLRPDRGVLYFMVGLDGMLLVQAGLLWISAG
ncbi:MAG: UbiA family prenyltransferase [Planctomycetota bacterium]